MIKFAFNSYKCNLNMPVILFRAVSCGMFICSLFIMTTAQVWADHQDRNSESFYKIGVLAYKGKDAAVKKWRAHQDYLNQALSPLKFEVIPLGYKHNELTNAVINHQVDFVITNPGHYTELELGGYVTRLATRRMFGPEGVLDQFGGAAITLPGNVDINRYSDLAGKKILIPSKSSLGGWQVHLREAMAQGVNLEHDSEIIELKNHKKVIKAVLAREGDVGFVRSDLIEQMASAGEIEINQLKVVNQHPIAEHPYRLSTQLYPEWPFALIKGTSREVATKVMKALLELKDDDEAARSAGIYGWTIPGNYSKVNDLFRETGLGPYSPKPLTIGVVIEQYWRQLLVLATLLSVLLLYSTFKSVVSNRLLHREIEGRKKTEKRLQLAANVFRFAQEGIMIASKELSVIDVNQSFSRITGYERDEIVGKTPRVLQSGRHSSEFYKNMWKTLNQSGSWTGEIWNKRKDGEIYIEQLTISAVYNAQGDVEQYLGIFTDITEYKNSEEALRRSQKMDAVGQLAGGVAHDFNNILAIILGGLDLVKLKIDDKEYVSERIDTITKAGMRAAELTKQLLGFSRHQEYASSPTDINQNIADMNELIDRSVTPEISVSYNLADNLWLTNIEPGSFEDSLLNLVINARDAIEHSGNIAIETRNTTLESEYCSYADGVSSGEYVELIVGDDGRGIPHDVQERLYEPFFTTKKQGEGTGLGLSMVFGFVKRSRGCIQCFSEEGVGTTFHIYLPRCNEQPEINHPVVESNKKFSRGSEKILVVDDEMSLLELANELLEFMGYEVVLASNGVRALEILEESSDIDLVFSDVVMPGGVNGYELAEKVKNTYPNIKVVLTSGFTGKSIQDINQPELANNILKKPYTRDELSKRIRAALDHE